MRRVDEDTEKPDRDDDEKSQPDAQPQGDPTNPPPPPVPPGDIDSPGKGGG
jgi:hypothetical protein